MDSIGEVLVLSIGLVAVLGLFYLFGPSWNMLFFLVPVVWVINFLNWWAIFPAIFWFGWWGNYFFKEEKEAQKMFRN
ncbi:hypothetical protein RCC89_03660 [Cytophagaceae bacterium ABcell3]|nr:hypothetical protein RCC89_03660 [Cytophagaceae bacterium ABcell3]